MATGYNVRIGDADREAIAAQLREHYADGRLTLDELNERLDQTFAAKTKADLDVVMRDLPHVARPFTDAPAASFGNTAWSGQAWPGPTGRSGWDYGTGNGRRCGRAAFAPLLVLMWVALVWRRGDAVRHRRRPAAGHRLAHRGARVPQAAVRVRRAPGWWPEGAEGSTAGTERPALLTGCRS